MLGSLSLFAGFEIPEWILWILLAIGFAIGLGLATIGYELYKLIKGE